MSFMSVYVVKISGYSAKSENQVAQVIISLNCLSLWLIVLN
jgi:hypothetical protein